MTSTSTTSSSVEVTGFGILVYLRSFEGSFIGGLSFTGGFFDLTAERSATGTGIFDPDTVLPVTETSDSGFSYGISYQFDTSRFIRIPYFFRFQHTNLAASSRQTRIHTQTSRTSSTDDQINDNWRIGVRYCFSACISYLENSFSCVFEAGRLRDKILPSNFIFLLPTTTATMFSSLLKVSFAPMGTLSIEKVKSSLLDRPHRPHRPLLRLSRSS